MTGEVNGTKCKACCSTPFGHSAVAGLCCHPRTDDNEETNE